jgi:hypothetical protein
MRAIGRLTTGRLRRRIKRRAAAAVAAAATAAVLAGCGAPASAQRPGGAAHGGVISLTQIGTLRSAFNHDAGHPRLVLIFSPT